MTKMFKYNSLNTDTVLSNSIYTAFKVSYADTDKDICRYYVREYANTEQPKRDAFVQKYETEEEIDFDKLDKAVKGLIHYFPKSKKKTYFDFMGMELELAVDESGHYNLKFMPNFSTKL